VDLTFNLSGSATDAAGLGYTLAKGHRMSQNVKETIVSKAKRMRQLMDEKADLEARLKSVNGELEPLRKKELPKLMSDAEIEKITVAGAGTLYLKPDLFVSMAKSDAEGDGEGEVEPPFYDWARQHAPDLIVEYIHPARLKAWAKEKLEAMEPLPNSLNALPVVNATLLRKG